MLEQVKSPPKRVEGLLLVCSLSILETEAAGKLGEAVLAAKKLLALTSFGLFDFEREGVEVYLHLLIYFIAVKV